MSRLEWSQAAVRLIEAAFPHSLDQPDARALCERLMPHVEASTSELSWGDEDADPAGREAVVRLLHRAAKYQEYRCDWKRALTLYRKEAGLRDLDIGMPVDRAAAWLAVGRQHFSLASLDLAEGTCRRALRLCEEPTADPAFLTLRAQALCELAGILRERAEFDQALAAAHEAISLYEVHGHGYGTLDWAVAEQQAGLIHRNAGRLREASACYERASALVPPPGSQEPAEHQLFRASLLRGLGIVAQDAGLLDMAENRLREALAVFRDATGPDFDSAQIAKFLADVLRRRAEEDRRRPLWHLTARRRSRARLHEAAALLAPAVALHRSRGETDEQMYAACLNKRGSLELALHRRRAARATLTQAEEIYSTHYESDHPYRAKTLARLGPVLLALHQREQAELTLREAKRIFENRLGPDHPCLIAVYQRLADCLDRTPRRAGRARRAQAAAEASGLREQAARITGLVRVGALGLTIEENAEVSASPARGRPSLRVPVAPPVQRPGSRELP
ncbi:tetratricopeptide (TPR) repeat protein [Streptacidiphilus sp. MAP12-20]|uniref:tetratricopeptide repeat protein n=1 Tax=Streptacidiphilus sp. MAP12-20 TaxID=3156299 RepID=UPI003515D82A